MATINRYTELTPSKFNPLSLQELMMVPSLQRERHDDILANQELLRQGLLKVDPLDVHLDEATKLREEMNNKLTIQAQQLAKEGVNPNSQSSFLALNRQYQDLMSPTGRIGQINNAKKVYLDNRKEFLEDATKAKGWSMERAVNAWNNFSSPDSYKGYDSKNDIVPIGLLGAPKKVETMEKLKDVHSLLGEQVVNEMRAGKYSFAPGPNGGTIIVNPSGHRIETSNKPNLEGALGLLQNQFGEKEWTDSRRFEGANDLNVQSQLINGVNSMIKTGVVDNRSENVQYIASPTNKTKTDPTDSNAEGYSLDTVNFSTNSDLLSKLENSTKSSTEGAGFKGSMAGSFQQSNPKQVTAEAIQSQEYKQIANGLARNNKTLANKSYDNPDVQKAVINYLKENKDVALDNGYVTPDKEQSNSLFESASDKKTAGERSFTLRQRIATGSAKMFDSKTGEPLSDSDVENMKNIEYVGFMKPKSIVKMDVENPNQKIMPTIANYIDKDGNNKSVYVTRDPKDFDKPFFKAARVVNSFGKIADARPNIYHKISDKELEGMGLHNIELKKNKNSGTYNMSAEIRGKNNEFISFDREFKNDSDLQNFIYDAYNYNQQ